MRIRFRHFLGDKRGTTFEGIALSMSVVAVGLVASADILDYMMKKAPSAAVVTKPAEQPPQTDLDMSPTASLPKIISRSVFNPCTGVVR